MVQVPSRGLPQLDSVNHWQSVGQALWFIQELELSSVQQESGGTPNITRSEIARCRHSGGNLIGMTERWGSAKLGMNHTDGNRKPQRHRQEQEAAEIQTGTGSRRGTEADGAADIIEPVISQPSRVMSPGNHMTGTGDQNSDRLSPTFCDFWERC